MLPTRPAASDTSPGLRDRVLELASAEGFPLVRIASAEVLAGARETALARQRDGMLADMAWMTPEWLERSTDPTAFLEGARSVILLALPYVPTPQSSALGPQPSTGRIARYAQGRDYHRIFEKKLRRIARTIRDDFDAGARATVDYGPLLERPLAARSGMGWLGKSTMLLVPGFGPWVMLGAIATTLDLEPDTPLQKTCGSCTRCIVACPTGAISPEGEAVDARLCISYHTIENRGPIPRDLRPRFGNWIFGCDDCLDSCPVGRHHDDGHPDFAPANPEAATPELAPLLALTQEEFADRFRGRAIMRAKRDGLLRNVCVALGNVGTRADLTPLIRALDDESELVRGHAAWALPRILARDSDEFASKEVSTALQTRLKTETAPFVLDELRLAIDALELPPAA